MTHPPARRHRPRQRGFSLIELSVVLLAMGLLGWAVSSGYGNSAALQDRDRARQAAESLRESLRAFALRNGRLPCPDTGGSGWEGDGGGACASGVEAGWLPYRSLGLDLPPDTLRAAYGVYRNKNAAGGDADLAVAAERTGDAAGTPGYRNARDLMAGLVIAGRQPLSSDHARLTGDDAGEGVVHCTDNIRSHPAFFIVVPLEDRDNDGNRFDAPHTAGSLCAYAPGTALRIDRDDVVAAESLASLTGWIGARAP
ncbi:type II secretion system protein [Acidovorax sp. Leaf160]|uniref:type II secretion system protein n=1 Tax=Acidovorax sp. Leaf160 TaxID=1736280 RepID=UPI0009E76243|nr:prepilin-type N-terminal cleavage/methylation domain-containing protein [Acidovorax sp. Leaf160]